MGIRVLDNLAAKIKRVIPLNIGEFAQAVKNKKEEVIQTEKAHKRKEFPIKYTRTDVQYDGDRKYLKYCLSLIKRENPTAYNILMLRISGYSVKRIAKTTGQTERFVSGEEKKAIRYMANKIKQLRKSGIPIVGNVA